MPCYNEKITIYNMVTELTIHTLELRIPCGGGTTVYKEHPQGSEGKLSTYKYGIRILYTIIKLFVREKPLALSFGILSALFALTQIMFALPVFGEYIRSGLDPRLPTAVLSASLMIIALLSFFSGQILNSRTITRHEITRLTYLNVENAKE